MTHEHERAAYNGLATPRDLPKDEVVPYLLLRIVYQHFRDGILPRDTAEIFKKFICSWEQVRNQEKAALLRYALSNVFDQARQAGAAADWDTVWTLMMAYMSLPIARGA